MNDKKIKENKNRKIENNFKIIVKLLNLILAVVLYSEINNVYLSLSLYVLNIITFSKLDKYYLEKFDKDLYDSINELDNSINQAGLPIDIRSIDKLIEKQEKLENGRLQSLSPFNIFLTSLSYLFFSLITYIATFLIQMRIFF